MLIAHATMDGAYEPDRNANRELLFKFYQVHDRTKVRLSCCYSCVVISVVNQIQNIDRILQRYASRIGMLRYHLERKYNSSPALVSDAMLAAADQLQQGHITDEEYAAISSSDNKIQVSDDYIRLFFTIALQTGTAEVGLHD